MSEVLQRGVLQLIIAVLMLTGAVIMMARYNLLLTSVYVFFMLLSFAATKVIAARTLSIASARQALERRPYEARSAAALTQARWMAEELRVSMFAQTLGTPNKVSMKRLLGVLAGAR